MESRGTLLRRVVGLTGGILRTRPATLLTNTLAASRGCSLGEIHDPECDYRFLRRINANPPSPSRPSVPGSGTAVRNSKLSTVPV